MENVKVGDILVSQWGATMVLQTFVKVKSLSPKTIVVEELISKSVEQVGFLKYMVVPTTTYFMEKDYSKPANEEGRRPEKIKTYRLYPAETTGNDGKKYLENVWFSNKGGYKLFFHLWDGKPKYEDHAD